MEYKQKKATKHKSTICVRKFCKISAKIIICRTNRLLLLWCSMFTIRRRGASRICQQFSSVLIICENETQITAQICAYKKVEKTRGSTPTPTASTSYFVWYVCVIIRYVNSVGCGTSEQVLKTFRLNTQASWRNISQQQHRILLHNLRCDAQQCKEFNLSLALRYNKRH